MKKATLNLTVEQWVSLQVALGARASRCDESMRESVTKESREYWEKELNIAREVLAQVEAAV